MIIQSLLIVTIPSRVLSIMARVWISRALEEGVKKEPKCAIMSLYKVANKKKKDKMDEIKLESASIVNLRRESSWICVEMSLITPTNALKPLNGKIKNPKEVTSCKHKKRHFPSQCFSLAHDLTLPFLVLSELTDAQFERKQRAILLQSLKARSSIDNVLFS